MPILKCGCVYADANNTPAVRNHFESGGYLKYACPAHAADPGINAVLSPAEAELVGRQYLATVIREPGKEPRITDLRVAGDEVHFPNVHVYRVPTREEFEQWILSRGSTYGVARKSNGQYADAYTRGAWAMRCAIITEFKP